MSLNANHLRRTIATLQRAITEIQQVADENDILYDLFRNAAISTASAVESAPPETARPILHFPSAFIRQVI